MARRPEQAAPPQPRPVQRTAPPPSETYEAGLFCSRCGTGNDTRRHFCRRCGSPLAQAAHVRAPWYRRLLPRRRELAAGDRPTGPSSVTFGSFPRRLVVTVLLVLLVGSTLAYAALPGFRQAVNRRIDIATRDLRARILNPGYVEVHPVVQASSELPAHPARFAADLVTNDYWAADTPQPTLMFTFGGKTDLDALLVISGASGADFARLARPKTVQLTYSDGTGEQLTLKDDRSATTYTIHARQTSTLTIRITSIYPVSGSTAVAITEVEFYRLK